MKNITRVEVFYDRVCGMCRHSKGWLERQVTTAELVFYPYQSEEAKACFPELDAHDPEKQMVIRASAGQVHQVYRGAEAWAVCLWCCRHYRWLARIIMWPWLLPFAQRVCYWLAANRLRVSRYVFPNQTREK